MRRPAVRPVVDAHRSPCLSDTNADRSRSGAGFGLRMGANGTLRRSLKHEKGIRWMPWRQEAMKDVALCEKPRGAESRL